MVIENAVTAANHGFPYRRVRKPNARCKVVSVGMNQRFLEQISVLRRDESSRGRVEIGPFEISFSWWGGELVSEAKIQRQPPVEVPVVLDKQEIHVLIN